MSLSCLPGVMAVTKKLPFKAERLLYSESARGFPPLCPTIALWPISGPFYCLQAKTRPSLLKDWCYIQINNPQIKTLGISFIKPY